MTGKTLHVVSIFIVLCVCAQTSNASDLPTPATTFNRAQTVEWLNNNVFLVGRWDGTITIFREPASTNEHGPVIVQALVPPSFAGVEMICKVNDSLIVSSNDTGSLAVWVKSRDIFKLGSIAKYDSNIGVANCAVSFAGRDARMLVVGHANGCVTIWIVRGSKIRLEKIVDVKTNGKPTNPYNLYNVRGCVYYHEGVVILGSEDGDITFLDTVAGAVISKTKYNPSAQRGINSIDLESGYLVVANCSVGGTDRNLWLYSVNDTNVKLEDSTNLILDTSRTQVFDFDVELFRASGETYFYASTEEGLLWFGKVDSNRLIVLSNAKVTAQGGAALGIDQDGEYLAAVSDALRLFKLPQ